MEQVRRKIGHVLGRPDGSLQGLACFTHADGARVRVLNGNGFKLLENTRVREGHTVQVQKEEVVSLTAAPSVDVRGNICVLYAEMAAEQRWAHWDDDWKHKGAEKRK